MRARNVRKAVPAALILFAAASTGTVLASDSCGVSVIQRLTDAAHTVQQHTGPSHRHTKETLAAWEVWGQEYLAKHGHAYTPPKRKTVASVPPDQTERVFEFLCDLPPVPTLDVWEEALLPPEEVPPLLDEVTELTEDRIPPAVVPPPPSGSTETASITFPSTYLVPIGGVPTSAGTTPTGPVDVPGGVTPEPESVVLLATGLAGVLLAYRRRTGVLRA